MDMAGPQNWVRDSWCKFSFASSLKKQHVFVNFFSKLRTFPKTLHSKASGWLMQILHHFKFCSVSSVVKIQNSVKTASSSILDFMLEKFCVSDIICIVFQFRLSKFTTMNFVAWSLDWRTKLNYNKIIRQAPDNLW